MAHVYFDANHFEGQCTAYNSGSLPNESNFALRGHSAKAGEVIFDSHNLQLRGNSYRHLVGRGQRYRKTSCNELHSPSVPTTKNYPAPNVNNAEV